MALAVLSLGVLKQIFDRLQASPVGTRKIMSLGYPDILAAPAHIEQIFGTKVSTDLKFHPDSETIIRWHDVGRITDKIVEAVDFFAQLGFELEIVDITRGRGHEIILDLNEPCPAGMHQRYALVIDAGTCEHCFNIAQAAKNLAEMVTEGGWIMQGNPFSMANHGFYNLNPTWYHDFYGSNGFTIDFIKVVQAPVFSPKVFDVPPVARFKGIPEECSIMMVARRATIQDIRWPVQTKYKKNPNLHG